MKVVVTDYSFPDLSIEEGILQPQGHVVVSSKARPETAELCRLVSDADAVITQFASINPDVVNAMSRARVIVRYGIGVDNVALDAAQEKNIPVCNVPDYCIDEVADHTLAFILSLTRQVVPNDQLVKSGKWGLAGELHTLRALKEMTIGIVGFGRIGREVVSRLRSFKCRILVFDPVASTEAVLAAGANAVSLTDLLRQSDLISLHCPSTSETRGMICEESLAQMKPGVVIVNLARGDLVNSMALTHALETGHVAGAALDVFAPEPIPADHPIRNHSNVVLASHIASVSVPAVKKLRETAAHIALSALQGQPLSSIVNGVSQR